MKNEINITTTEVVRIILDEALLRTIFKFNTDEDKDVSMTQKTEILNGVIMATD